MGFNYENGLYLQALNLGIPSVLAAMLIFFITIIIYFCLCACDSHGWKQQCHRVADSASACRLLCLLTISDHAIPPVKSFQWFPLITEAAPGHHLVSIRHLIPII